MILITKGTRANHYDAGFDYTFGFAYLDALKKFFQKCCLLLIYSKHQK
ncbi:hypothetical protein [Flavobacterium aquidurense]|nr:hypothetical protein [Flavobacterium aquidurense]MDR7369617.1 hypothetical protein [Flavobacterium aquidurense]